MILLDHWVIQTLKISPTSKIFYYINKYISLLLEAGWFPNVCYIEFKLTKKFYLECITINEQRKQSLTVT